MKDKTPKDQSTPVKNDLSAQQNSDNSAAKITELTNDLQRTRADFENFRKQVEAQRIQAIEAAKNATVASILPLLDQLQLAISTYPEQLQPLQKTFEKTLSDFKLQPIVTDENTPFSPDLHEAVMVEGEDGEQEVIATTLRPGYYYNGEVLRPAMVKVKRV